MKFFGTKKFKKNKKKPIEINSSSVRCIVKRQYAGNSQVVLAEFDAVQTRDKYNTVNLVNTNMAFQKDVSFITDKRIDALKYRLSLASLTHEERIKKIKSKISLKENIIKKTKNGFLYEDDDLTKRKYDENKEPLRVNIHDQKAELEQYKVLLEAVENEGEGSYEIIGLDGRREIHFLLRDGEFVPIFHNVTKANLSPDSASRDKILQKEQTYINNAFERENTHVLSNAFNKIISILLIISVIFCFIWADNIMKRSAELGKESEKAALNCAKYYGMLVEDNMLIYNEYVKDRIINNQSVSKKEVTAQDVMDGAVKLIQ
ncbi:MAG: hypothetical protein ACFFDN_01395 [Candidatus Hodarchaeota archaeon]